MTRLASLLALLAVSLTACSSLLGSPSAERIPGVRPGVTLGEPGSRPAAPPDTMPVLGDDGTELGVDDFRGRVLVLNFWASWCGPCRAEQPDLNEAFASLPEDEVAFLGVNIQDTVVNAQAHEREFDMPYPSLFDPANAYAARYEGVGPRSIPSTIVIDKEGRVAARLFGITNTTEVVVLAGMLAEEA